MKKVKYLIASLLCLVFATSIIASVVSKIKVHADEVDLTKSYLELTASELDSLSRRTNISTTNPQITVFAHGWASDASHWSNNEYYEFAYQTGSMIDELWGKIGENNVVAFMAKTYELGTHTEKEESEDVSLSEEMVSNGAKSLQCMYSKKAGKTILTNGKRVV